MDWTSEGSDLESRLGKEFSLFHVIQIGSLYHSVSYPIGIEGSLSGGKAAGAARGDHSLPIGAEVIKT